jgi:hypothetical protein
LRSKDRKLAGLPGYRYFRAATPHEVDRLLGWFFPVKARHLADRPEQTPDHGQRSDPNHDPARIAASWRHL